MILRLSGQPKSDSIGNAPLPSKLDQKANIVTHAYKLYDCNAVGTQITTVVVHRPGSSVSWKLWFPWKFKLGVAFLQRFKLTMRELQGAIIIGSAFQTFLGYSGAMSILLRYLLVADFPVERVPRHWPGLGIILMSLRWPPAWFTL